MRWPAPRQRREDPAKAAAAEERLLVDKGWQALGAFDPAERSRVLDLFGFDGQLVFATFASTLFSGRDLDRLYAGSAAQNKAMVDFCAGRGPAAAGRASSRWSIRRGRRPLAEEAIGDGCAAVMVPSTAAGERSPTHPDLDPFWDVLSRSNVPFVLHVGGGGRLLDPAFHDNAMPVTDHLGGGENVRSKDFLAIHHSPETFLGVLILDGLFDRFPALRGGCIEQGAGLGRVVDAPPRPRRALLPAHRGTAAQPRGNDRREYVRQHLKFTPFPGEDVGWMIEQAGPELFMFSTDFPHPEGGRDPLAKFEETLVDTSDDDQARFFADNMAELLGGPTG